MRRYENASTQQATFLISPSRFMLASLPAQPSGALQGWRRTGSKSTGVSLDKTAEQRASAGAGLLSAIDNSTSATTPSKPIQATRAPAAVQSGLTTEATPPAASFDSVLCRYADTWLQLQQFLYNVIIMDMGTCTINYVKTQDISLHVSLQTFHPWQAAQ